MQIRYTANPEDVGALLRYNLRHSPRFWLLLLAIALFPPFLFAFVSLLRGDPPFRQELITPLIVGLMVAVAVPFLSRWSTKSSERVLTIAPDGISTTIGRSSGEVPWRKVAFVAVTDEHIFITGTSGNGMAIPRRAFATDVDRVAFMELIRAYHAAALGAAARDV